MKIWVAPEDDTLPPLCEAHPRGLSAPSGLVWAGSKQDFYRVYGAQDICWSKSMIEEYTQEKFGPGDEDRPPHALEPWKVLKHLTSPPNPDIKSLSFQKLVQLSAANFYRRDGGSVDGMSSSSLLMTPNLSRKLGIQSMVIAAQIGSEIMTNTYCPDYHLTDSGMEVNVDDEPPSRQYERISTNVEIIEEKPPLGVAGTNDETQPSTYPKLEEFLPIDCFPDILVVKDPHAHTSSSYLPLQPVEHLALTYRRVLPRKPRSSIQESLEKTPCLESELPSTGHLDLDVSVLGHGNHAYAYAAHLKLPHPLSAIGSVKVAAKLSRINNRDLDMHINEGQAYSRCPKYLQEDWSGYNHIEKLESTGVGCDGTGVFPACAVVPKFYGYYVPVEHEFDNVDYCLPQDRCKLISDCLSKGLSPILLVEDCGSPINTANINASERTTLLSFPLRLHAAGMLQDSFYDRNVVAQPGPLQLPPYKRTMQTPSFRLIDYGRAKFEDTWMLAPDHPYTDWGQFGDQIWRESKYIFRY